MKREGITVICPRGESDGSVSETVSYIRRTGPEMIRLRSRESAAGLWGPTTADFSDDHGATWSDPQAWPSGEAQDGGVWRAAWQPPVPVGDRLLLVGAAGLLPQDRAEETLTCLAPRFRVSDDGGRTWSDAAPMIQAGPQFHEAHPFHGVWLGKNTLLPAGTPLVRRDGAILVPCTLVLQDEAEDGRQPRPPGAPLRNAAIVLEGVWRADGRIDWNASDPVQLQPAQSQSGAADPALADLGDGRLLMVFRASAGTHDPEAGYAWFSLSTDGGRTWGRAWPWTFSDGTPFYAPALPSRLFRHSSGAWHWFGVLCLDPPTGERPGYPLVTARLEPGSLRLDMGSLAMIDSRRAGDTEALRLGPFSLHEDRRTGDVGLRLTRRDAAVNGRDSVIRSELIAHLLDL